MKYLILSVGKIVFQVSILIFIIGYCFGFWFKGKNKNDKPTRPRLIKASNRPVMTSHEIDAEAA